MIAHPHPNTASIVDLVDQLEDVHCEHCLALRRALVAFVHEHSVEVAVQRELRAEGADWYTTRRHSGNYGIELTRAGWSEESRESHMAGIRRRKQAKPTAPIEEAAAV